MVVVECEVVYVGFGVFYLCVFCVVVLCLGVCDCEVVFGYEVVVCLCCVCDCVEFLFLGEFLFFCVLE